MNQITIIENISDLSRLSGELRVMGNCEVSYILEGQKVILISPESVKNITNILDNASDTLKELLNELRTTS